MNIKKITLCQSESWIFDKLPRRLDSDYNPCYDFHYPFSNNIALDCERIVYKLKEENIISNICRNLNVVFISDNALKKTELVDFIAFNQKDMRFVNVYMNSNKFNNLIDIQKRKKILEKICEAIIIVSESEKKDLIEQICKDVYLMSDDMECVFLNKTLKKYVIDIKFKSSLNAYTAILYINNIITQQQQRVVLFDKGTFADLEYKINKIIVKNNRCTIQPKNDKIDDPIIVNINV